MFQLHLQVGTKLISCFVTYRQEFTKSDFHLAIFKLSQRSVPFFCFAIHNRTINVRSELVYLLPRGVCTAASTSDERKNINDRKYYLSQSQTRTTLRSRVSRFFKGQALQNVSIISIAKSPYFAVFLEETGILSNYCTRH